MMTVDLQSGDSFYQSLTDEDHDSLHSCNVKRSAFGLKQLDLQMSSLIHPAETQVQKDDDDFIADLTSNMEAYCMFQSEDERDSSSSSTVSDKSEMSWPSWGFADLQEYKLWSPLSSKHTSGIASPSSTTMDNNDPFREESLLDHSFNDMTVNFEKIETNGELDSNILEGHGCHRMDNPTVVSSPNVAALIHYQIRTVQEQSKVKAYSGSNGNIRQYQRQERVRTDECGNHRQMGRSGTVPCSNGWPAAGKQQQQQLQRYQRTGSDFRTGFLGGSNARVGSSGTGVFLPRRNAVSSESRQKTGCSTVLIPARVVQALQQHFDQISAISATKTDSFPQLHDVLVHTRDGMYSLQQPRLQRVASNSHKDKSLPQEWTY